MRAVVRDQVVWARELLSKGWPLCAELGWMRGRALAFVLRWHAASLSALEARDYDIARDAPPAGLLRLVACAVAAAVKTGSPF